MDSKTLAATIISILILSYIFYKIFYFEGMTAERKSKDIIENASNIISDPTKTYSDYKSRINDADAVEYMDMKDLYSKGQFNQENIKRKLNEY